MVHSIFEQFFGPVRKPYDPGIVAELEIPIQIESQIRAQLTDSFEDLESEFCFLSGK